MVSVGQYAIRSDNGLSWMVGRPKLVQITEQDGTVREVTQLKNPRYFHSMEAALEDVRRRTLHDEVQVRGDLTVKELERLILLAGSLGG